MGAQDYISRAVEEFGLTRDPCEAGYILPDGRMLDFSGKRYGGTPGGRQCDHREIGIVAPELSEEERRDADVYGAAYLRMRAFMRVTGAIRINIDAGFFGRRGAYISIHAERRPTDAQIRVLHAICKVGLIECADVTYRDDSGQAHRVSVDTGLNGLILRRLMS